MIRNCFIVVAVGCALGGRIVNASSGLVERWKVAEIELVSEREYGNPYADVQVSVAFAGPNGQTLMRDAFWYGGNVWKVRFAPVAVGKWTWKTACTDTGNGGLHGRTGDLECKAYGGDLPLYQHGFLRISQNGRYLAHADGTPFFWLGDTHWQMPDTERIDACNHPDHGGKACPYGGQFQHLVADRKAKGFTVYQTYPAATSRHWWSVPYTNVNPDRFAQVFDAEMDHLAAQGFVIALGFGHFADSTRIPTEDLRRWARYLVARYGAYPVVWITCQEMNAPEDGGKNRIDAWRAVAEEIAKADAYGHPHSGHQWVLDVDARPLGKEPWHDWFALQGGHRNSQLTPQARYAGYYAFRPAKPMLETEAMYEQIDCGGVADGDDARMAAWKAMVCGCAGYTYGAAGIWALKWDPADPRWKEYNHAIDGWYAGMALPGSAEMAVMKAFFLELPSWWLLTPRFGEAAWATWEDGERSALATEGNRVYVAYCYGLTSRGVLKQLDPAVRYEGRWFDPRKGQYKKIEGPVRAQDGQWEVPEKPDAKDWVLIVQAER